MRPQWARAKALAVGGLQPQCSLRSLVGGELRPPQGPRETPALVLVIVIVILRNTTMGQQLRKRVKRARREAYAKRVKARIRAAKAAK